MGAEGLDETAVGVGLWHAYTQDTSDEAIRAHFKMRYGYCPGPVVRGKMVEGKLVPAAIALAGPIREEA